MSETKRLVEQAIALHRSGRGDEAIALYRDALALDAACYDALHLLGVALHQKGRHDEAVALIRRAIAVDARDPAAHSNLALALRAVGRLDEALASIDHALKLAPQLAQAHNNRGNLLRGLGRVEEAIASYDRAIALNPNHAVALRSQGDALLECNRPDAAVAILERSLAVDDRDPQTWNLHGIALGEVGRFDDAVRSFERALALAPDLIEAAFNRGGALLDLKRYREAAAAYAEVAARSPGHPFVKGQWLHAKMQACDWERLDDLVRSVEGDVRAGRASIEPFAYQAVATSPDDLLRCAEIYAAVRYPAAPNVYAGERYAHRRIRIGYVSGEFRQQATSLLMAGVFEAHDRERFEVIGFDNGGGDGSALRARLERSFDALVDIASLSDAHAAAAIRAREVDVLVNLNGYFGRLRQGVFARRAAPVQVNYLGFPGTLGARYIDYLIADAHVIPRGEEPSYTEAIVRLPDSYQANDASRPIADATPTRSEAGLPDDGFVFCCFNNNYKIAPAVFDAWMRLLAGVRGSVLWLYADNDEAARNLRSEAQRRGIAPSRLVFATWAPPQLHLARHRLADLFVDTLPYNAHTTASDALWAGLPVVTVRGTTFPGRVATSLLHAVGLPRLVASSLAEYEALALRLATSPSELRGLRNELAALRDRCPLFDTRRFCRHLEAAYATMVDRHRAGAAPASFDVGSATGS